jgi:hypothetical protein
MQLFHNLKCNVEPYEEGIHKTRSAQDENQAKLKPEFQECPMFKALTSVYQCCAVFPFGEKLCSSFDI